VHTSSQFNCAAAESQPRRNIARPFFAPRQSGALRRSAVEIVGIVMLGSVALWMLQLFDKSNL
jgi:hypothetical protein